MYFAFQLILSNWEGLTPPSDENQIPISSLKKKLPQSDFFSDVPSVIEIFFFLCVPMWPDVTGIGNFYSSISKPSCKVDSEILFLIIRVLFASLHCVLSLHILRPENRKLSTVLTGHN